MLVGTEVCIASKHAIFNSTSKKLAEAALEQQLKDETVDVTIPGTAVEIGHKHPMYTALDEIKDIFVGMGFTVLDGPEVELATNNFDRLNAEEGHPSRDWSDTFYFDEDSRVMLRSQTSPMQVRAITLDEYKEMKLEVLSDCCIHPTEDERRHMMNLKTEVQVDQFCRSKIMNF